MHDSDEALAQEAEVLLKQDTEPYTQILALKGLVAHLEPQNPHGGISKEHDPICNVPKWVETATRWVKQWRMIVYGEGKPPQSLDEMPRVEYQSEGSKAKHLLSRIGQALKVVKQE